MKDMKSIKFPPPVADDMVRAILEGRKTVTRRVVKLKYSNTHLEMFTNKYGTRLIEKQNEEPGVTTIKNPDGTTTHRLLACIEKTPPYRPGDILYVRETWTQIDGNYVFKADDEMPEGWHLTAWCPSIHMPRKAARIFLRVTDVRVERLQDITEEQTKAEGACKAYPYTDPATGKTEYMQDERAKYRGGFACVWDACYSKPRPVKGKEGIITHYESYPWDDIQETRTYRGKPWYVIGNPYIWAIEFERISREEAVSNV